MPTELPDPEATLTSSSWSAGADAAPLLGLTVLWHPDWQRVGQQYLAPECDVPLEVHRFAPGFSHAGGPATPLGHRGVARDPLRLQCARDGSITLTPPLSRMQLEADGVPVMAPLRLRPEQLEAGVVLQLGGAILLCLHWMRLLPQSAPVHGLVGVSAAVLRLRRLIAQAAATTMPVLLLGETGTGKEVAARAIHAASARRDGPLVAVNMAALSEALAVAELFGAGKGAYTGAVQARAGLFAEAGGGTLFLDEIGATPALIQPMLLRVLESAEYRPLGSERTRQATARVIAATDADLAQGSFNQPLLRRLEAFVIHLAPLRQRRADIGVLIVHFAAAYLAQHGAAGLPTGFIGALCRAPWPGNIRQLGHVVQRALIALEAGEALSLDGVAPAPAAAAAPAVLPAGTAARAVLAEVSDQAVLQALQQNGWQLRAAAQALGVSRPSMYKLLARHPQIRAPQAIAAAEIAAAIARNGADWARSAAQLGTPAEALRRHARGLGLADATLAEVQRGQGRDA
ncbi:sigma 54-interacting transcriptional regulator [Massilia sp. erpn]|uniref:sigma 54-interacting transcriptional regulator n=1 Tax=Massilia sp. erpn TaxID=2738142 RepID=UPI002105EBD0|nr:sigma 54-interacting transcriptional regulator [Massilia sp. erpn]UTY56248.1 sigma-54-dependent Fis family transcriptional regulator [Massilia sp. erpn]